MKPFKFLNFLFLILAVAIISSCTESDIKTDPTKGLVKISEGIANDAEVKVELWARQELFTGYNELFIQLRDIHTNKRLEEGHIHLEPMMAMTGGMSHSCPFENPVDEFAVNGLFPVSAMFVMPSSDMGSWTLHVGVHNHANGKSGETELDITVVNPSNACIKSFVDGSSTKYFIGYNFPEKVKVGINEFTAVAYKQEDMMSFPAAEYLTFVLTPEMPAMEHGSPNNVDPVHESGAFYHGKVNFTMTGLWRLHLEIRKDDVLLQEVVFDVEVE
jgi:hypothetical protein